MAAKRATGGKAGRGAALPGVRVEEGEAPTPPDTVAAALAAPAVDKSETVSEAKGEPTMTTDAGEKPVGAAAEGGAAPRAKGGRCAGVLAACSLVVAVLALAAALASPFWMPKVIANDEQAGRVTVLGAAHLSNAIASGRPFDTDLALIRAAVPNLGDDLDRVLGALHVYAPAGRPALSDLQRSFDSQSSRLVVLKVTGKADQNWLNWTAEKIASVVRLESMMAEVSRPDTAQELEMLRSAAEAMLAGQVQMAVASVDRLAPDSQQALAEWRAAAVRQVALDGYAAELDRLAKARSARGPVIMLPW
ncbi:MAG: hypothetical protein AB7G39_09105 [Alphaproteobacteria bacterium]